MKLTAALLLGILATSVGAAPRPFSIGTDGRSAASFKIDDTIETINGTTSKVAGTINFEADNIPTSSVMMSVDLRTLDSGNSMRDADMRDTLGTARFPLAVFKSTVVNGPPSLALGEAADLRIGGDFTLHGVTRRISLLVRVTRKSADRVEANARFTIRMTDYDIAVPDKLVISVANEVTITFEVAAVAR